MRREWWQICLLLGVIVIFIKEIRRESPIKAEVFNPQKSENFAADYIKNEFHRYKLYEKHRRFPDVIIAGAGKCGSGILKHYLHGNPYFNAVREDAHYFDSPAHYAKGPGWYMSMMPRVYPYHRVYERTPSYFSMKKVPGRLFNFDPKTKIIIMLCDPVTRALEHYATAEQTQIINGTEHLLPRNHIFTATTAEEGIMDALEKIFPSVVLDMMRVDPDFDAEEIREILYQYLGTNGDRKPANFVTRGVYGYHIRHWYNFFPKDQILLLNKWDLQHNPWKVIEDIQEFTGVDHVLNQNSFIKNEDMGWYCTKLKNELKPSCPLIDQQNVFYTAFTESTQKILEKLFSAVENDLTDLLGKPFQFRKSIYDSEA